MLKRASLKRERVVVDDPLFVCAPRSPRSQLASVLGVCPQTHGCARTGASSGGTPADASSSADSASLSAQPYSSSSGRQANLCCSLQSAPWHERLQYRTRPQHEHRRNSCRRVSTRPHRGCEHEVVPSGSDAYARFVAAASRGAASASFSRFSPYQSSRNRFSVVAVRCACAAVKALGRGSRQTVKPLGMLRHGALRQPKFYTLNPEPGMQPHGSLNPKP